MRRAHVRALVVAAGAGILALALLPVLLADGSPAARAVAWLDRLLLPPFCHQIPARCLWIAGVPTALCARCTGLFLGAMLAGLLASERLRLPRTTGRLLALAALFVMALDVLLQGPVGLHTSTAARFTTGLLAAALPLQVALNQLPERLSMVPAAPAPAPSAPIEGVPCGTC